MTLWSRYAAISPARVRILGTVTAHNPDGTASLQLPEGTSTRVRNPLDITPPYRAFVVDGVIESAAPSLPVVSTEG